MACYSAKYSTLFVEVFSGVKSKSELDYKFDVFDLVSSTSDETTVLNIDDFTRVVANLRSGKTRSESNTYECVVTGSINSTRSKGLSTRNCLTTVLKLSYNTSVGVERRRLDELKNTSATRTSVARISFPRYDCAESSATSSYCLRNGFVSNEVSSSTSDLNSCLLYTSPSPRDGLLSRMPSSA